MNDKEEALNKILINKDLKASIELKGNFTSSIDDSSIYIQVKNRRSYLSNNINCKTFKTSLSSLDAYSEKIFKLIDTVILEKNINDKIDELKNCPYYNHEFSGFHCNRYEKSNVCHVYKDWENFYSALCDNNGCSRSEARQLLHDGKGDFKIMKSIGILRFNLY